MPTTTSSVRDRQPSHVTLISSVIRTTTLRFTTEPIEQQVFELMINPPYLTDAAFHCLHRRPSCCCYLSGVSRCHTFRLILTAVSVSSKNTTQRYMRIVCKNLFSMSVVRRQEKAQLENFSATHRYCSAQSQLRQTAATRHGDVTLVGGL